MSKSISTIVFLIFVGLSSIYSQILIKELPPYDFKTASGNFLHENTERMIIQLNENWNAYTSDSPENAVVVTLPCLFTNANELIFRKEFTLTETIIYHKELVLNILGLNYSAEILLNDVVIFKNDVANIPVSVPLSRELLKTSEANDIKIIVRHQLDGEATLPPLQRFLFPQNYGGITRDVFIEVLPVKRILLENLSVNVSENQSVADLLLKISNNFETASGDSTDSGNLMMNLIVKNTSGEQITSEKRSFMGSSAAATYNLAINNPNLWTPENPVEYLLEIEVLSNGSVVDRIIKSFSAYELTLNDESVLLNGKEYSLNGTTYVPQNEFNNKRNSYAIIREDLSKIKSVGFNTVRFSKHIPHPYALQVCSELGLLAFIEIPVHGLVEEFAQKDNYSYRVSNLLNRFISQYGCYSATAAIGLGTSYISNSLIHAGFINKLAGIVKANSGRLTYASFIGTKFNRIDNLDLYGLEIFNANPVDVLSSTLSKNNFIKSAHLIISEATYPDYYGKKSGYLEKFSSEAQAKYFEDVINESRSSKIGGFFINTFYNYSGDFASLYAMYDENNKYHLGLNDDSANPDLLTNKVINSKLTNSERITIPIGAVSEDAPIFIILVGLTLAVLMAILINSKKKFREDATRALLRPYNFYSDIRDQRIISGVHTVLLMFILAGSHGLLLTNLLFYLKNSILFEKILLSFGSQTLMKVFGFLTWHPVAAFIYSFIASMFLFGLISALIKIGSFFIKNKVNFLNIYFVVIWAFLPLALLLPVKLILYRILEADIINYYIYAFLVVYLLWIFQRIIKGVYVIFDTSRSAVYFYSIIFLLLVFGSALLFAQLSNSTLYYITTALKQFQLI